MKALIKLLITELWIIISPNTPVEPSSPYLSPISDHYRIENWQQQQLILNSYINQYNHTWLLTCNAEFDSFESISKPTKL